MLAMAFDLEKAFMILYREETSREWYFNKSRRVIEKQWVRLEYTFGEYYLPCVPLTFVIIHEQNPGSMEKFVSSLKYERAG